MEEALPVRIFKFKIFSWSLLESYSRHWLAPDLALDPLELCGISTGVGTRCY